MSGGLAVADVPPGYLFEPYGKGDAPPPLTLFLPIGSVLKIIKGFAYED